MESFSPHLGRYLDLYRHAGNFHFAVPSLHSFSPHDRDVGSEDGHARSRPALRRAAGSRIAFAGWKGAHAMITLRSTCSRVSVRRVSRALQTPECRASHSEAATVSPHGKEGTQ